MVGRAVGERSRHCQDKYCFVRIIRRIVELIEVCTFGKEESALFNGDILQPVIGDKKFLDPACGSGGMFVQAARYMHRHNATNSDMMRFRCYGVEKDPDTVIAVSTINLGEDIPCIDEQDFVFVLFLLIEKPKRRRQSYR